jgi:phosphorylase/glycogen(starch) synthase
MIRGWDSIDVVSVNIPDSTQKPMILGESFKAEVVLDMNELSPEDVGIEVLFGKKVNDVVNEPILIKELEVISSDGEVVTFGCEVPFDEAGVYDFAFRLFPKNELRAHRQDFSLVKWI